MKNMYIENDYIRNIANFSVNTSMFHELIEYASNDDLNKAIEYMKANPGGHKCRIYACKNELRKHIKNPEYAKYVSQNYHKRYQR